MLYDGCLIHTVNGVGYANGLGHRESVMSHTKEYGSSERLPLAVRWLARITSVVSIGLLAMFATEPSGPPTGSELALMAFFPVGVVIGMMLGWWKEALGGLVTIASLAVFYVLFFIMAGKVSIGPYFAIFASPGLLFLLSAWLHRGAVGGTGTDRVDRLA